MIFNNSNIIWNNKTIFNLFNKQSENKLNLLYKTYITKKLIIKIKWTLLKPSFKKSIYKI